MVDETQTHPAIPSEHRFSILVTDDDSGSRDALAGLLESQGFYTITARCGEEAIEIVRVEMIHLVFLDMHMPRMTGLDALQQVRVIHDELPAILVTADATRELIRRALHAHVYSVIPKPVNKNIVLHTVARALHQVYGEPPEPPGPSLPTAP
jgi:two-component system, response regulator PdtaR